MIGMWLNDGIMKIGNIISNFVNNLGSSNVKKNSTEISVDPYLNLIYIKIRKMNKFFQYFFL